MRKHVSKVASVCYFHLRRRLKTIRRVLGEKTTVTLAMAFVINRLDYCNTILAGLLKSSIVPLQRLRKRRRTADLGSWSQERKLRGGDGPPKVLTGGGFSILYPPNFQPI